MLIGTANHWFDMLSATYSCLISLPLLGLILRTQGDISTVGLIAVAFIPVIVFSIPVHKAVFSKDRYLVYFKQFEKKDRRWHKKWSRITTAYSIGALLSVAIGACSAFAIFMN